MFHGIRVVTRNPHPGGGVDPNYNHYETLQIYMGPGVGIDLGNETTTPLEI